MKVILINNKDVGISNISTLLRKLTFVFRFNGKLVRDFQFSFDVENFDAVTALIVFKFFEYSVLNQCLKNPQTEIKRLMNLVKPYKIDLLFKKILSQDAQIIYKQLKPQKFEGFFIAPHAINRDNFDSRDQLEQKYSKVIEDFYKDICPDLIPYFITCICEVASNFLYHALEDKNSILLAHGNDKKIEIVCVDNSKGIISNLNSKSKNHKRTIKRAFMRGVSSKKDVGHCGTGLWEIQKITEHLNGTFRVFTEDMAYITRGGKVFVNKSSYWDGSIVYLKLNVTSSKNINEFFSKFNSESTLGLINNINL